MLVEEGIIVQGILLEILTSRPVMCLVATNRMPHDNLNKKDINSKSVRLEVGNFWLGMASQ